MKHVCTILCALALIACGESDAKNNANNGNNGNNANNQNNVAANCQSRCETRAGECDMMASGEMLSFFCQNEICSYSPSESEVACLEGGTCNEVAIYGIDPEQDPCGIRVQNSNNANNANNGNNQNNGSCTPGCNSDGDLIECSDLNGTPVTTTIVCGALGCEDGACVQSWEVCDAGFEEGGCDETCNASSVTVNGVSYCSSRCGPNDECPSGTECNGDLNGGECLPPCTTASDCPEGFLEFCPESGFCGA